MNPQYPIYIISKSRWESRLTSKALESMDVPYSIVVEPQEYKQYASVIDKKKILVLPFSNLGQGSIPARNWVWEHALTTSKDRHWIMDDNIRGFGIFNQNSKIKVASGTILKAMEDFTDRYTNIAFAGPQYDYFCPTKEGHSRPPFSINTRIYSCILIKNDLKYRWRGKYNEDTDLSLRALKDGWCTILYNMFIQYKITTLTMKGGNTDHVYIDGDNRMKFAQSLKEQHPDVVSIVKRYNRWHHQVDYRPFRKNKLAYRKDFILPKGANDYGLILCKKEEGDINDD